MLDEKYGVQLVHDSVETTWENHGYVTIKDASGKTLVESEDYQHNKSYRQLKTGVASLIAQIKDSGLDAENAKEMPSESGNTGSTAVSESEA